MTKPTFDYEPRTTHSRRPLSVVGRVFAVLSLLSGVGLGYLFIVGFGMGDSWVIYPPAVPLYWWLVPAVLIAGPILYFARPDGK